MTPLRKRMTDELILQRKAVRTRKSYLNSVALLAQHFMTSPDQLRPNQIRDYILHLHSEQRLKWSTINGKCAAFNFLYRNVLGWSGKEFRPMSRKLPQTLPEVLSATEIERLFAVTPNLRDRVLLMAGYACGLRVSEACRLRVGDIRSERGMLLVQDGKGAKSRYTPLPQKFLFALREYWVAYRPSNWLFPGRNSAEPLSSEMARFAYQEAKVAARITRPGSFHTLRHSFATHALEGGMDCHVIQKILGHRSIKTTLKYLHVTDSIIPKAGGPFDRLNLECFDHKAKSKKAK